MLTNDQTDLFQGIPGDARVWIYQADRKLNSESRMRVLNEVNSFIKEWKAHGNDLNAAGDLLFDQFVVLAVDERKAMASGCSIDSSTRKLKQIGESIDVNFFDRSNISYIVDNDIRQVPFRELKTLFDSGVITGETIIFDNTVQSVDELRMRWMVRLKDSPAWQLVK